MRIRVVICLGLLVPALGSGGAWAQDLSDFHLDSYSGYFRLRSEYWDEMHSNAFNTLEEQELAFRESLMLRLLGDYYHEKLLAYDLRGEFGLEQRSIDAKGGELDERDVDTTNTAWEVRAKLFKDLRYSGETYSFRTETRSRQTFFDTTEAIIEETGANLYAREWWAPSRFHVHRHKYRGRGLDTHRETRDSVLLEGSRNEDYSRYQYALEMNDVQLSGGRGFDDKQAHATMTKLLGKTKEDRWFNNLRVRSQKGTVKTNSQELGSSYHRKWTKNLLSDHGVQLSRSEIANSFSENITISNSVGHQLFASLSSGLGTSIGRTRFDEGDIQSQGVTGRLVYTKETPLGQLGLRLSSEYTLRDQDALQALVPVVDEPHRYDPGVPIYLERLAVDHSTVIVKDQAGIPYLEGSDYILLLEGSRTRIEIPVGSRIITAPDFLVDYLYSPNPAIEFTDRRRSAGLSMRFFEYATFDVDRSSTRQDLRSGTDTDLLQDTDRTTAALRFYPYHAVLGIEYEDYDSNFTPYERITFRASNQMTFRNNTFWNASSSAYRTDFKDVANEERGLVVATDFSRRLKRDLYWDLRGEWHQVSNQTDEGSGYLLESNLVKNYRLLEVSLRVRLTDEEFQVASDRRIFTALLTITRRF